MGIRADGGGGSRTFGETNGVTGSGWERIAGVGGEDGERGGVPGSASWSGTAMIADTSGDRGGSGGGGGGAGDGGATSAVPVDPDEILGVFFRGENIPMAIAGEAPVGVGRGRGGGARGGGGIGEFLVVTAEQVRLPNDRARRARARRHRISLSSLFSTSSCYLSTGPRNARCEAARHRDARQVSARLHTDRTPSVMTALRRFAVHASRGIQRGHAGRPIPLVPAECVSGAFARAPSTPSVATGLANARAGAAYRPNAASRVAEELRAAALLAARRRASTGVTTSAQKSRSASAPASTFPPSATTATAATTSAGANAESARLKAAWQLYYTHENAYLNWVRNGITATAVGTAFAMFRLGRDQAEFSLGGVVMQTIGLTYVLLGAAQYLGTAFLLRHELCISGLGCLWYVFNAAWPTTLFVVGMRCIHDHHPPLFISALAANVELLPAHLQSRCMEIVSEMRRREFDRERERRNEPRA